jgi:hypothetical protein
MYEQLEKKVSTDKAKQDVEVTELEGDFSISEFEGASQPVQGMLHAPFGEGVGHVEHCPSVEEYWLMRFA